MKPKFIHAYMDVAKRFAQLSYAQRLKVGAIVVKDDRIISIGYNGMPSGWENNCEEENKTRPEVLHAESNAIAKLARSNDSGVGADIFITHSPCIECAKLIFQSGIERVYFGENYRNSDGLNFLTASKINVIQVDSTSDALGLTPPLYDA
jgi:dCMP deaminase